MLNIKNKKITSSLMVVAMMAALFGLALGFSQDSIAGDCDGGTGGGGTGDCPLTEVYSNKARSKVVMAGIGMYDSVGDVNLTTNTLTLEVPSCSAGSPTIERASLTWVMRDGGALADPRTNDDSLEVSVDAGTPTTVTADRVYEADPVDFGGPSSLVHFVNYNDSIMTGLVLEGSHTYTISGFSPAGYDTAENDRHYGFGIQVEYSCPEFEFVEIVGLEGNDIAYPTVVQTWGEDYSELMCTTFDPRKTPFEIDLMMHMPGADGNDRFVDIWYTTGSGSLPNIYSTVIAGTGSLLKEDAMGAQLGTEWDIYSTNDPGESGITVPAGDTYACIQIDSSDDVPPLSASMTTAAAWFSVPEQYRIGNQAWFDIDNDGQHDASEDVIEGLGVELYLDVDNDGIFEPGADDGSYLATTTTNADGRYWFEGLNAGDYFVAIPDSGATSVTIGAVTGFDLSAAYNSNGSSLSGHTSNSFQPTTDSDVDNDDDGRDSPSGSFMTYSGVLSLASSAEPTGEYLPGGASGDDETEANTINVSTISDANSNLSVDFGFYDLPDLAVTKTVDGDMDTNFANSEEVEIDQNFEWRITVTNQSELVGATAVDLIDFGMPDGVSYVSSSATQGSYSDGSQTWTVGSINAGASASLDITAVVASADYAAFQAGDKTNTVEVLAMNEDDKDSTPDNQTADPDDLDSADVYISVAANISLKKYVVDDGSNNDAQTLEAGPTLPYKGSANYVIVVTNTGTTHLDLLSGQPVDDKCDTLVADSGNDPEEDGLMSPAEVWTYTCSSDQLIVDTMNTASVIANPVDGGGNDIISLGNVTDNDPAWVQVELPASLGNFVWYDTNANGIQDEGELGVDGITVKLYNAENDQLVTSMVTGDNPSSTDVVEVGWYYFTGLPAGSYYVVFDDLPDGFAITDSDNGDDQKDSDADAATAKTVVYVLEAGDDNPTVDGGIVELPESLSDTGRNIVIAFTAGLSILAGVLMLGRLGKIN